MFSTPLRRPLGARDVERDQRPADLPAFEWTSPLLFIAVLVHAYLCWRLRADLAYDARFAYLPFARRLLNEGWAFLADEQSIWAPFFSYAYPALLDANVQAIGTVNLILSCSIVLMLFRVGARAHSTRAGLIAAWIYAALPSIAPLVINVLTELPFLFFCAVWIWAFGELCGSGQRRWAWIAGLALGCAVNTRASLLPFIFASFIVAVIMSARSVAGRGTWRGFSLVQGIAAALTSVVIIKNWVLFDLPQIATGGGNAFYLGNHTLTGGYEPSYSGVLFDVGAIASGEHLAVEADRALRAAGWDMLRSNPWDITLANWWRKTWAFLFYPNVLLADSMFTLRSLRICLLGAAGVAMIRGWRNPILLLAAAVAVYQVGIHVPLLYNPRYSEGALDLWLALLAGCGFATVSRWPPRGVLAFALALTAACYAGKTIRHLDDRVAPLRFNASVPHRVLWKHAGTDDRALTGFVADAGGNSMVATSGKPSIQVRLPDVDGITGNAKYSHHNLFLILEISTPPTGKRCDKGRVDFQPEAARSGKPALESYYPFRLKRDSDVQTFSFGVAEPTATWRAAINGPGTFKIEFSCDEGAIVRLERLAIAESTHAVAYRRNRSLPAPPASVSVIEYYHRALDHYFITWVADEIAALDAAAGDARAWTRTGQSFKAYATAQFDTSPVCRFYIPPDLGNSHFFGSGSAECDATEHRNPRFVLESPKFMHMQMPLRGECPADTVNVYRVFNNRKDTNHRYMTDPAIRDEMTAKGWLVEGEGPRSVVMCAPK